jgi:predicted Fe-S protein YdhL (DUF1289 family)
MEVPSPCVRVCVIEPRSGYCRGCRRTLPEIAGWAKADDRRRLEIVAQLSDRSIPTD